MRHPYKKKFQFCRSYQPVAQAVMANSIALRLLHHTGFTTASAKQLEDHFLRSTRNRANSLSVSARSPKLPSFANASFTSASAFLIDASIPNNAG